MEYRNCANCGTPFLLNRKDKRHCSQVCAVRSYNKGGTKVYKDERKRDSKILRDMDEPFKLEMERFVKTIKAKNYWADQEDILQLINYYDIIRPNSNLTLSNDTFADMFYVVAKFWFNIQKDKV
jgi:hypothetical protein